MSNVFGGTSLAKSYNAIERRRILERLNLLATCGAGLAAFAPLACEIARDWIGAQSGSIFWRDGKGLPAGFYHDCAPPEVKDLFVTKAQSLFTDPNEFSMISMSEPVGPSIGRALEPDFEPWFKASNVYHYLCRPLGHECVLDLRISNPGSGAAVIALWNPQDRPFHKTDATRLQPIQKLLELALENTPQGVHWVASTLKPSHLIADIEGKVLLAISNDAESTLKASHLLNQNVPMAGQLRIAPSFVRQLAGMIYNDVDASTIIPVAGGRLRATASINRVISDANGPAQNLVITLQPEIALNVIAAEHFAKLPLTFLQKQISMAAIRGISRRECQLELSLSDESYKKHLRAIYDATQTSNWRELATLHSSSLSHFNKRSLLSNDLQ